jgi:hypothetical protein
MEAGRGSTGIWLFGIPAAIGTVIALVPLESQVAQTVHPIGIGIAALAIGGFIANQILVALLRGRQRKRPPNVD